MIFQALPLLRAHLEQLRAGGRTTVPLGKEARQALRNLARQPPGSRTDATSLATSLREEISRSTLRPPAAAVTTPPAAEAPATRPTPPPSRQQVMPVAAPRLPAESSIIEVPGTTVEEQLARLAAMAETDPKPRALGSLRGTMVFAVGSPQARLMFIGEAPGAEEERQREPFVGPAGQLLTKIIENAMGLKRPEVYISNICKFRPGMGDGQGSRNRQPTPEEMQSCLPYIMTEIHLIRPQVIVALGATAATGLGILGAVGRLRGRFHEIDGIPVMVTYHPSYILRQEQEGAGMIARRQVWEDMLLVMEKLQMPISEKQRGYFRAK